MKYFFSIATAIYGPIELDELKAMHAQGRVSTDGFALQDGGTQWESLGSLLGGSAKTSLPDGLSPALVSDAKLTAKDNKLSYSKDIARVSSLAWFSCVLFLGYSLATFYATLAAQQSALQQSAVASVWLTEVFVAFAIAFAADRAIRAVCSLAPPPMIITPVSDAFVWAGAFAPLFFLLLDKFANVKNGKLIAICLIVNSLFCWADSTALKKKGFTINSLWVVLVPGHLYKRSLVVGHGYGAFVVWCILVLITCFA